MKIKTIGRGMLILCFAFLLAAPLYAADRPSTGQPSGDTPQTGDEQLSKQDAEMVRGKVVKAGDGSYTIETSPGTQVTVRSDGSTKFENDYKGMEGDWIEAVVSPEMHIATLKKSTPAYSTEGHVLTVNKEFFVVKDSAGKEIRLNLAKDTAFQGNYKVGDRVKAEFTPEGRALSIKPAKPPVGPPGA